MTVSRDYVLDHFDEVCDRAEQGEEIVLERPGRAAITLVPHPAIDWERRARAVKSMQEYMRSRPTLEGSTVRELIEEGRRY